MNDRDIHNIAEGLSEMGKNPLAIDSITPAFVKSVNNDNEVICEVDELEVHNVRLKAIETGNNESLIIVPEDDSWVLIGCIEDTEEFIVLSVQKAKKLISNIAGITFEIDQNSMRLNGDQHGNLLIEQKLVDDLKKVNDILAALKQVCSTPVNEPGNGSPSVFQQALNAALSSLNIPAYNNISNQKVQHG